MVRRMEGNEQSVFTTVKRKVYSRRREGSQMTLQYGMEKAHGTLAPSVGALWVQVGGMWAWKAGEEVGLHVEAALSRWDLVGFWLLFQTYFLSANDRASVESCICRCEVGEGLLGLEVGNG